MKTISATQQKDLKELINEAVPYLTEKELVAIVAVILGAATRWLKECEE